MKNKILNKTIFWLIILLTTTGFAFAYNLGFMIGNDGNWVWKIIGSLFMFPMLVLATRQIYNVYYKKFRGDLE